MPWQDASLVELRHEFVLMATQDRANISRLADRFGISRPTAYKWIKRYEADGKEGLADRSRRPKTSPNRTPQAVEEIVCAAREEHPSWSGYKIRHLLLRRIARGRCELTPDQVPAASTCQAICARHGLVNATDPEHQDAWQSFERSRPNALWQMDFKGHFACDDQTRCYPLTLLDDHSRFSLTVKACENQQHETVSDHLRQIFERYGRPEAMLMDNGSPWGSSIRDSAGQPYYTRLSAWLMRLGIEVIYSGLGHPQTHGKLERMHRSLDAEALRYQDFRDLAHCQKAFDVWRSTYNLERPHESLDAHVPAERYQPSPRPMPDRPPAITYGPDAIVRKVDRDGYISYKNDKYKIGKAFTGDPVALRPTRESNKRAVYYCDQSIKTIDLDNPNMPS